MRHEGRVTRFVKIRGRSDARKRSNPPAGAWPDRRRRLQHFTPSTMSQAAVSSVPATAFVPRTWLGHSARRVRASVLELVRGPRSSLIDQRLRARPADSSRHWPRSRQSQDRPAFEEGRKFLRRPGRFARDVRQETLHPGTRRPSMPNSDPATPAEPNSLLGPQ
jgi:hypothetical protein